MDALAAKFTTIKVRFERLFFTRAQQQAFLEDVSTLIEDGVPLSQAVATIRQIYKGAIQEAATNIIQKLGEGKSFADGMVGWFTPAIVEINRAGESGGRLPETLRASAAALAQESYVITSLLSSTVYPLAVILMALIVAIFVKNSVFINFAEIKPVKLWPSDGRTLYHVATFLQHWWIFLVAALIGLGIVIAQTLHGLTGKLRTIIDSIPLLSLYRYVQAARFMETLGLLITNGITLKNALSIMHQDVNPYLSWHLYTMEFRLSGGKENIGDVLDTGLIQESDILRLKAIAKSKGFEHALIRLGKQAASRNAKAVSLAGKVAGAVLLFMGAGFAAFMIFAIYDVGNFVGT